MVDEAVNLDLTSAFAQIDQLEARLTAAGVSAATEISDELAAKLSAVAASIEVDLADPDALTEEVDAAVAASTGDVEVALADPDGLQDEISSAVAGAEPPDVEVSGDTSGLVSGIEDAVAGLEPEVDVGVEVADPGAITATIEDAVGAADGSVVAELVNPAQITDAVSDAVADAAGDVTADLVNPGDITGAIEQAVADADVDVVLDVANAGAITDSIEGAIGDADTNLVVEAEVSPAAAENIGNVGGALDDVTESAGRATSSLGGLTDAATVAAGAAAAARADVGGLTTSAGALSRTVAGVGSGVLAFGAVLAEMTNQAAEAENASRLMDRTFGNFRATIEQVNVGGLNEQLSSLALRLGSDDDAIRIILARLGDLAQQTGATQDEVKAFTDGIVALSARAVALNPNLGSIEEVANRMGPALLRGGRFAQELGIALTDSDVAAELAREGIQGLITDLSPIEQQMIKVNAAVNKLGDSLKTDIDEGAASAVISFRAFRQSITEELEAAGAPLVPLAQRLATTLQPVLLELIDVIGIVGEQVLNVLVPALEGIGPPLADILRQIGDTVEELQPLFQLVGQIAATILPPLLKVVAVAVEITAELVKWTTPLGLALQLLDKLKAGAEGFGKAFLGAGESIQDIAKKFGFDQIAIDQQIASEGLQDFIDKVKTAQAGATAAGVSFETWGAAAQRAGVSIDDVQGVTNELNANLSLQNAIVAQSFEDFDRYATALGDVASSSTQAAAGTGQLFDAIEQGQSVWAISNEAIDELRGRTDELTSAMDKLGTRGPAALQDMVAALRTGGLSTDEFKAKALELGITVDELAAVEQEATDSFETFAKGITERGQEVADAFGGISDATKELSDEGKQNIDEFVAEVTAQLEAAANFSNNIALLFAQGAETTAQAFLDAGQGSAGALQQLVDQGIPKIDEVEGRLSGFAETAATATANAAEAARVNAINMGQAIEEGAVPDPAVVGASIEAALGDGVERAVAAAGPSAASAAGDVAGAVEAGVAPDPNAVEASVAPPLAAGIQQAGAAVEPQAQATAAGIAGATAPDAAVVQASMEAGLVPGIERALAAARETGSSGAFDVGLQVAQGTASGMRSGLTGIVSAAQDMVRRALAAARREAAIGSPSRLFATDIGIPLTEGVAEGILEASQEAEDAITQVIENAQSAAEAQLNTVFSAFTSARGLTQAQDRLNEIQSRQASLINRQKSIPEDMAAAQREYNQALAESEEITAREQLRIEQMQDNVERIRAQLAFQDTTGPQDLADAQRALQFDQAELERLRAVVQQEQNAAILGTGSPEALRAAQAAFQTQQRTVQDAQRAVDDLTRQMTQNRVSQLDLQVAVEDLAQAQEDAVGPTDRLRDAQRTLKDLEDEARAVKAGLLQVTKELPDAQIALMQATARAALAGEAFNRQGLAGLDILLGIGKQAGFAESEIVKLTKAWAGLASTIATNLGGTAFGAPLGQVDIGSIINPSGGPRFVSPDQALAELNFVRGINGQTALTMQQAPWNINIYQATDPVVVAQTVATKLGLAGVR